MKKLHFVLLLSISFFAILSPKAGFAQNVGINADASRPDSSAMLDVKSANKGLLIPRVALTGTNDVTTIATPATSLLVYNTANTWGPGGVTPGYYYWTGTIWLQLAVTKEYAYIYNSGSTDFVKSNSSVRFYDRFDIDFTMTSGIVVDPYSSSIFIKTPGVYKIEFSVSADQANQFSIYKNGTEVPGSKYISTEALQQNNGMVIVNILFGDRIELRNVGAPAYLFAAQAGVTASIMITQL